MSLSRSGIRPDLVPDRPSPDHARAAKAEPEAFVIETIMYFGIGFLCASLLGWWSFRWCTTARPADDPAAGSRDPAVDGGNPGRQGPVAGRVRDVDAAAGNERRAAQDPLDRPAQRARQEDRSDRHPQARAGRQDRRVLALEAREKALKDQIRATEQEYSIKATAVHETGLALADKEAALAKLTTSWANAPP